jgi:hypothetical protein
MSEARIRLYAATVLEFDRDAERSIDLGRPLSEAGQRLLEARGLLEPFAILTAWNPRGQPDHPENDARQAELEASLDARGVHWRVLDGCAPDRTHREASVAAVLPEAEALSLAVEWEQDAYFWYDGAGFWLVGALEPYGRVRLPLPGAAGNPS